MGSGRKAFAILLRALPHALNSRLAPEAWSVNHYWRSEMQTFFFFNAQLTSLEHSKKKKNYSGPHPGKELEILCRQHRIRVFAQDSCVRTHSHRNTNLCTEAVRSRKFDQIRRKLSPSWALGRTCSVIHSPGLECSQLNLHLCCLHHIDSFLVDLTNIHRPTFKYSGNENKLQSASGKMGSSVLTAGPQTGSLNTDTQFLLMCAGLLSPAGVFFCDWDQGNRRGTSLASPYSGPRGIKEVLLASGPWGSQSLK